MVEPATLEIGDMVYLKNRHFSATHIIMNKIADSEYVVYKIFVVNSTRKNDIGTFTSATYAYDLIDEFEIIR